MSEPQGPVLLYDGYCGFCNRAVRLVLRVDDRGLFRFAPLHGEFADRVIRRHPGLRGVDSLVLVEGAGDLTGVHVRSDAVLRAMSLLGGAWRILLFFALVPRPVRDWAYDLFARWRYRIFGRYDACPVPPPEVRDRFLA